MAIAPPPNVPVTNYSRLAGKYLCGVDGNTLFASVVQVDSVNNSANTRKLRNAPKNSDLVGLVVEYSNTIYASPPAEISIPNAFTVMTYVEYPIGTTAYLMTYNGNISQTITPGPPTITTSDEYPYTIPAGAQYAIREYVTWNGTLNLGFGLSSILLVGDWTERGVNLVNHARDLTVRTHTAPNGFGFGGIVRAKLATRIVSLGAVGDSWFAGVNDIPDTFTRSSSIVRAMRLKIPVSCTGIGGYRLQSYITNSGIEQAVLRNAVTHVIVELAINDVNAGTTLATLQANIVIAFNHYLSRGIKVYGWTIPPRTTSSNGYLNAAGQTVVSSATTSLIISYNNWLRANWASFGLTGLIDAGAAIDPTDSGFWSADVGALVSPTAVAQAAATVSGGVVSAVVPAAAVGTGNASGGSGFGNTVTIPWTSYAYPGESGSGAAGMAISNASGQMLNYTIVTPGSGYATDGPPMINLVGPWTIDGLHPSPRGWNEIIKVTGLGPGLFSL